MATTEILHLQLNDKKLMRTLEGPAYDVFARTLRGLATTKVTKAGKFLTADRSGHALRCSYKVCQACCFHLLHRDRTWIITNWLSIAMLFSLEGD